MNRCLQVAFYSELKIRKVQGDSDRRISLVHQEVGNDLKRPHDGSAWLNLNFTAGSNAVLHQLKSGYKMCDYHTPALHHNLIFALGG